MNDTPVVKTATCRCGQEIVLIGDKNEWWHKFTGDDRCYPEHKDINSDIATPRMEPWT